MTAKRGTRQPGSGSPILGAFNDCRSFLQRFVGRFLKNRQDVEDVVQEAFLRAYVAEQTKEISQPTAYLFRTAKNLALNQLALKSRQITDYLEEVGVSAVKEYAASADDECQAQESLGQYCEAVAALPEKCRQVFLLSKVHGLSHAEIAERMSLSVSSVEKYLKTGLLECRAFLDRSDRRRPAPVELHRPVPRQGQRKGKNRT